MTSTMVVRAAVADDVPAIADLCSRATRQAYTGLVTDDYIRRVIAHWYGLERLHREIAPAPSWFGFDVADLDGRIAGVGGCGRTDNVDTCELYTLYVEPSHQRRGVGRALVARAVAHALAAGASRLDVAVMPGNDSAIGFYLACGFTPAGERPIYAPHGAEGGPEVVLVYRRDLGTWQCQ